MKWLNDLFKFFASLKLAIFLIVILGIAFGAGTFIESYHGARAAQALIYRTQWLAVLLALLALNLLASAFDRIPWKKKHIGFLTTHLGIILMLVGALVTQAFGIEGQVQIREGETEGRMTISESLLQVIAVDSDQRWTFSVEQHIFPWTGRENLRSDFATPLNLYLVSDYPKAKREEKVIETKNGSPALHVSLVGSMASMDEWLLLESPERSSVQLGPAAVRYAKDPIQIQEQKTSGTWGTLTFHFESGGSDEIPLSPESIGKTFSIKNSSYRVSVRRILKDAVVNANELVDRSSEWLNPAVQLTLEGENLSERHTVFAKFPEFPTLHGLAPSEAHVRIAYEVSGFSPEAEKNEIRFLNRPNALPEYQVKRGSELKGGKVELNKPVETGWMDFKFTVDRYFEHAALEESYLPLPNTSGHSEAVSVIELELETLDVRKNIWLVQGEMVHVPLKGSYYHVVHGLKTRPLGFQVELKDFMMDTDPGTDRPASFKSLVTLKDPMKGIKRDQLIQMNEPLKYRGFKLYQSAYHLESGQPDISIFTAARDPGNPFKYTGAIIMVLGILALFYMKPFSTLKGSDPKLRSR